MRSIFLNVHYRKRDTYLVFQHSGKYLRIFAKYMLQQVSQILKITCHFHPDLFLYHFWVSKYKLQLLFWSMKKIFKASLWTGRLTLVVWKENFEVREAPTFKKPLLQRSAVSFGQLISVPSSLTSLFILVKTYLLLRSSDFRVFRSFKLIFVIPKNFIVV